MYALVDRLPGNKYKENMLISGRQIWHLIFNRGYGNPIAKRSCVGDHQDKDISFKQVSL